MANLNGGYAMIDMNADDVYTKCANAYATGKMIIAYDGNTANPANIRKSGNTYTVTTTTNAYTVTESGTTKTDASAGAYNYSAETGVKTLFNFDEWKSVNIARGTAVVADGVYTLTSTGNDCYTEYNPLATNPYPAAAEIKTIAGNEYEFTWKVNSLTDGKKYRIAIFKNGANVIASIPYGAVTSGVIRFIAPSDCEFVTFRLNLETSGTVAAFSEIMCRNAAISDGSYAAYVPTNAELYAMIQALTPANTQTNTRKASK